MQLYGHFTIFTPEEGQEDKRIAILEKIKPKMQNNSVLHELLGDLYKKSR